MPRLLNILGFVIFVLGAVALAVAVYVLLAGVIGWNPFSHGRPMIAGLNTMLVLGVAGLALLIIGALLARAAARAQWRQEIQATVAP
ncbi:hypothetical protein J8J14_06255 [Roseomonas sp. SSH11]|uniref:Uncharacterized protein n=1 Tax=Pararoseomonas baculiformis TaxID=2820812 RepID=A0ABS4ABJ2_9PROT|nr:hypothetical protein [Pararoseomonas baculiformis]MBP0444378.1 hypothetical protein [Pararoseomonas baculiformis]